MYLIQTYPHQSNKEAPISIYQSLTTLKDLIQKTSLLFEFNCIELNHAKHNVIAKQ